MVYTAWPGALIGRQDREADGRGSLGGRRADHGARDFLQRQARRQRAFLKTPTSGRLVQRRIPGYRQIGRNMAVLRVA